MITYRRAHIEDSGPLIPLMKELGYEHSLESISANFRSVENAGGAIFVAESDTKVVGCICAIIDARLAEGMSGELVSAVVLAEFQGQGVGRGLILCAEDWLKARVSTINVRANVVRETAHKIYQRLGYVEKKSQKIFTKNVRR